MKLFCFLTLIAVAIAAIPVEEGREHGENGWYVPQQNNSWAWMSEEEAELKLFELEQENELAENSRGLTKTPTSFSLYTKQNPKKRQKITASKKSINKSNFNPQNPTRFIIHGWEQGYLSSMNKIIRNAWLSKGEYNVIVVDWARGRSIDYLSSVSAVRIVGKKVAAMIDFLRKNYKMSLDTLHVIGHSLGAHVAGHAGKRVKRGKINTIVGLDVAMPLFSYKKTKKRLASTDAVYVESIHTCAGELGFLQPIGKGAFYPNGGKSQPGCGWDLTGICDHERSNNYYAEAIRDDSFPAMKCKDYKQANNKACGTTYSPVRMGAESNAHVVSGEFFVPVNGKKPYGMGS